MKDNKLNSLIRKRPAIVCLLGLIIPLAFLMELASCQHCNRNERHSEEEMKRLMALSDSLLHGGKDVLRVCDSLCQHAPDSLTFYDYYLLKSRKLVAGSSPESALPYAWRALHFVKKRPSTARTRGLEASAYSTISGYYYHLRQSNDSATKYASLAYEKVMQSDRMDYAADMAANLADTYVFHDDLPKAAHWYRRALLLADSLQLPKNKITSLYMGLAQIYTMMKDFEMAEHFYQLTEERRQELRPNMVVYFLNNYGNLCYFKGDYQCALKYFTELRHYISSRHEEKSVDMHSCYINLADVFLNLYQLDSAMYYLKPAEQYFKEMNIDLGVFYANTIRIGIAMSKGNYQEVERILDSESDSSTVSDHNIMEIRNRYLKDYYVMKGDYRSAYKQLLSNHAFNDSAEHNKTKMRSIEIMTRLTEDTLRLHHKLAIEEKNLALTRTRNLYWSTSCIVVILLSLIIIGTIYMRKRRLQNNIDVMSLRLANARQRISPHFVFNLLNTRLKTSNQEEKDLLMDLVKLIRQNLNMVSEEYICLSKELDFVKRYVELERILLGEDFDFVMETPPESETSQIFLPSMFIQILVENAILHGVKNREGHQELKIIVDIDEKGTDIRIVDNGPGFDIRYIDGRKGKTGLNIIRQTIMLINQRNKAADGMRFNLSNLEGEDGQIIGCCASLHIPSSIRYFNSTMVKN